MIESNCPCGRQNTYANCCERPHQNRIHAITAEDLMRSRFTAFTKAMSDYLVKTHHSSTRHLINKEEIVTWAKSVKWLRLEILEVNEGKEDSLKGIVEFKAHFKAGGKKQFIHENSYFEKEFGLWKYVKAL